LEIMLNKVEIALDKRNWLMEKYRVVENLVNSSNQYRTDDYQEVINKMLNEVLGLLVDDLGLVPLDLNRKIRLMLNSGKNKIAMMRYVRDCLVDKELREIENNRNIDYQILEDYLKERSVGEKRGWLELINNGEYEKVFNVLRFMKINIDWSDYSKETMLEFLERVLNRTSYTEQLPTAA